MNEEDKYLTIGNATTVINSLILIVAGYIIGGLASIGFNLPVSQAELASILTAIIFGVFSYINAKKHNNLFDNETDTITIPVNQLNEAEITAIQNFINHNRISDVDNTNSANDDYLEDVDVAGEYNDQ